MKTITTTLALILLIFFTIVGCKKDSKNDETKNFLKVDGTEYDLSKGLLIYYGGTDSIFSIDLFLLSSGLTVYDHSGFPDSVRGTGHMISFELLSSNSNKLGLGDYAYNFSNEAGSFYYSEYILNWNSTLQPDINSLEITSGTVKVLNNGTEYELSFTGTDSNNKPISGYYKGALKYYSDAGDKKSLRSRNPWK